MDLFLIFIGLIFYILKASAIAGIGSKAGYKSPATIFFIALLPIADAICLIYIAFNDFPIAQELAILRAEYEEDMREADFRKKSEDKNKAEKEYQAYTKVADELASNSVNKGIWLKAETMTDGDEAQTKKAYVKMRVESLLKTS